MNIGYQVPNTALESGREPLERDIDISHIGNFAGFRRQIVAHESVKMNEVGSLPKSLFHRTPMALVKLGLQLGLKSHQYVVADEVRLAEFQPGGVHALKDHLWVVLRTV